VTTAAAAAAAAAAATAVAKFTALALRRPTLS
jgi:hypothetical protein